MFDAVILSCRAAAYGLSDTDGRYYQLGGHGFVPVRFHPNTLSSMALRGLLIREGYWKATEAGRAWLRESASGQFGFSD